MVQSYPFPFLLVQLHQKSCMLYPDRGVCERGLVGGFEKEDLRYNTYIHNEERGFISTFLSLSLLPCDGSSRICISPSWPKSEKGTGRLLTEDSIQYAPLSPDSFPNPIPPLFLPDFITFLPPLWPPPHQIMTNIHKTQWEKTDATETAGDLPGSLLWHFEWKWYKVPTYTCSIFCFGHSTWAQINTFIATSCIFAQLIRSAYILPAFIHIFIKIK